jgi:hypothetical protein
LRCLSSALNYKPTAGLQDEYRYTAISEHFRAYYDIIPAESGVLVRGVLQNNSRTFASNVILNISENQPGHFEDRSFLYKNLGNIKMFSHKPFEFHVIGQATHELLVNYEFVPSAEDSFINQRPDDRNDSAPMDVQPIRGTIRLTIN